MSLAFCLGGLLALVAAEVTPLKPGATAPDFQLADLSGEQVTLESLRGDAEDPNVVVMVFWSRNCPWVVRGWDPALQELREHYAQQPKVKVAVINSNQSEVGAPAKITAYLQENKRDHRVLLDHNNVVADAYGGLVTPHAFVIGKDGKIVYQGLLDDSIDHPGAESKADCHRYVMEAVTAALQGEQPTVTHTSPKGCQIKRASRS